MTAMTKVGEIIAHRDRIYIYMYVVNSIERVHLWVAQRGPGNYLLSTHALITGNRVRIQWRALMAGDQINVSYMTRNTWHIIADQGATLSDSTNSQTTIVNRTN